MWWAVGVYFQPWRAARGPCAASLTVRDLRARQEVGERQANGGPEASDSLRFYASLLSSSGK